MTPIPTSGSLVTPSLTLEHLSSIPKRNNDEVLLAYHREQRRFLELYASYGRAEIKSWDTLKADSMHTSDLPAVTLPQNVDDFVFGTPVLKARVPKLPKDLFATPVESPKDSQVVRMEQSMSIEKREPLRPKTSRILEPTLAHNAVTMHDKSLPGVKSSKPPKPKKRSLRRGSDTDEGQENRLAERRQRKKTKRDIMKRDLVKNVSDEEQEPKKRGKKSTKAEKGFALMHGFSATNVGKNRLTLDPRQTTGVFKKGKASNATKVLRQEAKRQQTYFSESNFLNSTKKGSTRRSMHIDSSSVCSPPKSNSKKRCKHNPKKDKEPSETDEQSDSLSARGDKPRTPYNPDESIVWHIEKESALPDSDELSHMRQGTILVPFPQTGNGPQVQADSTGMDNATRLASTKTIGSALRGKSADCPASVLSLGPSQSASQVGVKEVPPQLSSNYFKTAPVPPKEIPKLPIHDPKTTERPANVKHSDPVGTSLPHIGTGLDLPVDRAGEQISAINVDEQDAMAIDESRHSLLDFPNSIVALQCYGFDQEPSYWSEVNWDGCDEGDLPYIIDPFNFSSMNLNTGVCLGSEVELACLQSCTGDEEGCFRGDLVMSDRFCDVSSHLGGYEDRPSCLSPTYLEGPYIEGTATDNESVQDASPYYSSLPFCEEFNASESEAYAELDAVSEGGKDERGSHLESSVHSAFQEEYGNIQADNFYQGRTLLYGLNPISGRGSVSNRLLSVEAEVAGLLKLNHWLPQKL